MVKEMSEDLIKVIVDSKEPEKEKNTGLFKCIFKAEKPIEKSKETLGLNLLLEGKNVPEKKTSKKSSSKLKKKIT